MKYVAALSGGVDSSVVAALLKDAGHDVVGITLKLAPDGAETRGQPRRCCSVDDALDARAVATRVGIPFYVLNAQDLFAEKVVEPFVRAYRAGETPIPCVVCNTELKFGHLVQHARALGATLATGHYARRVAGPRGPELHRPFDLDRDQTYFLHAIGRDALDAVEFPLGEMEKAAVRDRARALGLAVMDKPDSQEICFVAADGHAAFVEQWDGRGRKEGRIVDLDGRGLGTHPGIHAFTVGQRKGLAVASTDRLYVLRLDAATDEVVVGPERELVARGLVARQASWLLSDDELADVLRRPVEVQVRARHRAATARVERTAGGFLVAFDEAQKALAPGQCAVVYAGTRCLGGGVIEAAMDPWPHNRVP